MSEKFPTHIPEESPEDKGMSRRDFLKKSLKGIVGLSLASQGFLPKETFAQPDSNQTREKNYEHKEGDIIDSETIRIIEDAQGKIEYHQDGILVVSQPDSAEPYLKNVLLKNIDLSKYDFSANAGGHNGLNTRWFITQKFLSSEQPFTDYQTGEMSEQGVIIEKNIGNFLSIFQDNESIKKNGGILDQIRQQVDMEYFSVKSKTFENGKRFFLTKRPDKKDSVELKDIEVDNVDLNAEKELSLLNLFNDLCVNYPGHLDKIQIFHQKPSRSGIMWGTAAYDKKRGINIIKMNDLSFQNPNVLKELATHEYGHLVYNSLPAEVITKVNSTFNKMDRLDPERNRILTWFNQKHYVDGSNIGYDGYSLTPNASELYPMAFSVLNLNREKFYKDFYSKGTMEEKRLIDELIKCMPKNLQ